jgi:hypothetical protein
METLSKIAVAVWGVFLLFVLSALFISSMPIYWLWLALGSIVCALLVRGLRTHRSLVIVNAGAAVVFLGTFTLYWIAIATTIYGDTPTGALAGTRLENMLYVIVGNFQQGQIWAGLRSAYIQLLMPLIQLGVLIAAIALAKRGRTGNAAA